MRETTDVEIVWVHGVAGTAGRPRGVVAPMFRLKASALPSGVGGGPQSEKSGSH